MIEKIMNLFRPEEQDVTTETKKAWKEMATTINRFMNLFDMLFWEEVVGKGKKLRALGDKEAIYEYKGVLYLATHKLDDKYVLISLEDHIGEYLIIDEDEITLFKK